jgi:hypothetical protein
VTLVNCEECDKRVAVLGPRPQRHGLRPDGPRRVVRHKTSVLKGRMWVIDWCPGKFERQEVGR